MNFKEFQVNVEKMKNELDSKLVNAEDVKIEYMKYNGSDCLWAMNEKGNVLSYFKW